MTTKQCKLCLEYKPIEEFLYNGKKKYGRCRACRSRVISERYYGGRKREPETDPKVCKKCGISRPLSEYWLNPSGKSHQPTCRWCKGYKGNLRESYSIYKGKKVCALCLEEKDISEFSTNSLGTYNLRCKSCLNGRYTKGKLGLHPSRTRNAKYINSILEKSVCVDCGNSDRRVLEFDHVRGEKKYPLSYLKSSSMSILVIDEELAKCEIRCANCHRIRHWIDH